MKRANPVKGVFLGLLLAGMIFFILALIASPASAHGIEMMRWANSTETKLVEQESEPQRFTFALSTEVSDVYWASTQAIFWDDFVSQTDLSLTTKRGWVFGAWLSTGLTNTEIDNEDDEVDLYLGKVIVCGSFECYVGVAYYALTNVVPSNILNLQFRIGRRFSLGRRHEGELYLIADQYLPVEGTEPREGLFAGLGWNHTVSITERLSFQTGVQVSYDTGTFDFDDGLLRTSQVGFEFALDEQSAVYVRYIQGGALSSNIIDGRRDIDATTVGWSWTN